MALHDGHDHREVVRDSATFLHRQLPSPTHQQKGGLLYQFAGLRQKRFFGGQAGLPAAALRIAGSSQETS